MRRLGLAPRALAGALLCQGLVMAWLAATRQRLPPELRSRPSGVPTASMQVVHAATLYLRVAKDVAVLNSACGSPVRLHGAWEWFDGVLLQGMLRRMASGGAPADFSDWHALLRGDATLIQLFESLRPVALNIEAELEETAKPSQGGTALPTDGTGSVAEPVALASSTASTAADTTPTSSAARWAQTQRRVARLMRVSSDLWRDAGCAT